MHGAAGGAFGPTCTGRRTGSPRYTRAVNGSTEDARQHEVLVQAALALASELSLPVVLQKIVDLACEVADARYGALGVVGADEVISEFLTHGVTDEERARIGALPEGHGLLGVLIKDEQVLRMPRIQDDPRSSGFPPNHPPMSSFLGVPVAIRGHVFGNLYLTEKRGAAEFTDGDEDSVVKLAAQAAVAIDNARLFAASQRSQRRLAAVNDVAQALLGGRDVDDVLRLIARAARDLVGARVATIATPHDDPGQLVIRVAEGDAVGDLQGMVFPALDSVSGEVMRTGAPILLQDASSDTRIHQPFVRVGRIGPALFVPLALRGAGFGTLAVGNDPGERRFTDDDLAVVESFAAQAAVALEHARIQDELKRLALVRDRERIAKELHDDVIQSLFAEGMALQASLNMLDDRAAMEARISQAVEHIDRVIRDLRNYIFALTPGAAADHALERSLRDVTEGFADASGLVIELVTDGDASSRLSGKTAEIVQAVREAVSNAVRHSGADHVRVSLACATDVAMLEVADNGKGFDLGEASGRGRGLRNLQARAHALDGELDIESAPGRGTWIRIRIPL